MLRLDSVESEAERGSIHHRQHVTYHRDSLEAYAKEWLERDRGI